MFYEAIDNQVFLVIYCGGLKSGGLAQISESPFPILIETAHGIQRGRILNLVGKLLSDAEDFTPRRMARPHPVWLLATNEVRT